MFLKKVQINKYRNFNNATITFQDGVNIIIGPNNAGKTNLLKVINLLDNVNENQGTVDDFNKNDLINNIEKYREKPPAIDITYYIKHVLNIDKHDDAILRLKNFILYNKDGHIVSNNDKDFIIDAAIMLKFEFNSKFLNNYKDEMKNVTQFEDFILALRKMIQYYSWNYYNTTSQQNIKKSDAQSIFNIDYVPADRNTGRLLPYTRKYVKQKVDNYDRKVNLQNLVSKTIREDLKDITETMTTLLEEGQSNIGITNGNNKIIPTFTYESSFEEHFKYILRDNDLKYEMPINNNGLGYNNLIQIYNIIKFRLNNDYNILLIEEPEAHLHPAMQYKLFKYLNELKQSDEQTKNKEGNNTGNGRVIKNQIFVTTHSPNISAAASIDNMISLKYCRDIEKKDYKVIAENLKDKFKKPEYLNSKKHLTKFLDVTRSDMMFAHKVILVEGLAEKLLVPAFAKLCGIDYELECNHISVVEVGGINFKHFLPLFNETSNKILCFRDCDYKYFDNGQLKNLSEYEEHLKQMEFIKSERIKIKDENGEYKVIECDFNEFKENNNIKFKTQKNYGSTFENELFLDNYNKKEVVKKLLKIVTPEALHKFIDDNGFNLQLWHDNCEDIKNAMTKKKINQIINPYSEKYSSLKDTDEKSLIEKVFFANLFLSYCKSAKGDLALNIVTSDLISELQIPQYIKEGLEWLK